MLLDNFSNLFQFLAEFRLQHSRGSSFYQFIDPLVKYAFAEAGPLFKEGGKVKLGEFGDIVLPYTTMGAVDSIDLFGLDELLLFAFYSRNRGRYSRAIDIGGNLGLHSILMTKCGFQVETFEPDPAHYDLLIKNLRLNDAEKNCQVHRAAVSDKDGQMEFVRVIGNTTSSHLSGAKANPYGELERFAVTVQDIKPIAARSNFAKIDAEGHESVILTGIAPESWAQLDAVVEIGTLENAKIVFEHFHGGKTNIFAQRVGWERVKNLDDMPTSYRDGSLFISNKDVMPWI